MLFSGITFLFYFLPPLLIVYYLLPKRFRNLALLLASLIFYFCGEPKYLLLMLLGTLSGYVHALLIAATENERRRRLYLVSACTLSLLALGVFKYADFVISNINALGFELPLYKLALPIGISFYTFQILSYVIDVYRRKVPVQTSFVSFAAYVALFPQLIAGPIVRYADISSQLSDRSESISQFAYGVRRFIIGLGKKVLLANSFAELIANLSANGSETILGAWLSAAAYMLQLYFDFSGYSDMAIGLGNMFGFTFPENFNYPYTSLSITEFWRRWHISLGSWFRDYVYIPLGGNRVGISRHVFNIFVVWMLTGLWHGAEWNFVVWGIYFAVFLLAEKYLLKDLLPKTPKLLRRAYVLLIVLISFVIFSADGMRGAIKMLSVMFGGGNLSSSAVLYGFLSYLALLVVGIVAATPLPKKLFEKLSERNSGTKRAMEIAELLLLSIVLILSVAYLADGTFNPFLYFRF